MNFDMTLPHCPVCQAEAKIVTRSYPEGGVGRGVPKHTESIRFQCGNTYYRHANAVFSDPEKVYGLWSDWTNTEGCSKAQEVALKLLNEKKTEGNREPWTGHGC